MLKSACAAFPKWFLNVRDLTHLMGFLSFWKFLCGFPPCLLMCSLAELGGSGVGHLRRAELDCWERLFLLMLTWCQPGQSSTTVKPFKLILCSAVKAFHGVMLNHLMPVTVVHSCAFSCFWVSFEMISAWKSTSS